MCKYRHIRSKDKSILGTIAYQPHADDRVSYGLTVVSDSEKVVSKKEGRRIAGERLDQAIYHNFEIDWGTHEKDKYSKLVQKMLHLYLYKCRTVTSKDFLQKMNKLFNKSFTSKEIIGV